MFRLLAFCLLGVLLGRAMAGEPAQTWRITVEATADGGQSVLATLDADSPIKSGFAEATPRLVLRYRGGRTLAYVLFDTYLGSRATIVQVRYSAAGQLEEQEWRLTKDERAVLVPGDGLAFIRRLKDAPLFAVTVTPPKSEPVTAHFTPTEVDLVIKALLKAGISYAR